MSIFFSEEYSGFSKKSQVIYSVKSKRGAVACATEEIYKNVQNLYLKNDIKAIETEIKSKNCITLESGEELEAYEGICDIADKNSVKLFKSKKVFLQKIYVPCFAVEMKKIIEEPQSDLKNKDSKQNQQNNVENKKSSENQPQKSDKIQENFEEKNTNEQPQENLENKNSESPNNKN
jgi:hypothetical protein